MKKIMVFAFAVQVLVSSIAFGQSTLIQNSDLSIESQRVIVSEIQSKCGFMNDMVQQLPTLVSGGGVGSAPVYLKVTLSAWQKFDQFHDDYMIYVDAVLPFGGDESSGLLQVNHIRCEMK